MLCDILCTKLMITCFHIMKRKSQLQWKCCAGRERGRRRTVHTLAESLAQGGGGTKTNGPIGNWQGYERGEPGARRRRCCCAVTVDGCAHTDKQGHTTAIPPEKQKHLQHFSIFWEINWLLLFCVCCWPK
jgi:hypothetical protein